MCGRFGFIPKDNFYERFTIANKLDKLPVHYNIAPGMTVPVIVRNSPNTVVLMRWGMVPFWAKDPRIGYKMINARAEGIDQNPAFRKPFRSQRCLIPSSLFYEWKLVGKEKMPYVIKLKNTDTFAFAGLYDVWKDAEGFPVKTFAIITTEPNEMMMSIHNRMPVIMDEDAEDVWLDPTVIDAQKLLILLKPFKASEMEAYPVSKLVNNPVNDTADVIKSQENK